MRRLAPPDSYAIRPLLAGEPVDRRTLLRAAACAALGLPALAACGTTSAVGKNRGLYGIDLIGGYLPEADLERLIAARAHEVRVFPSITPPGTSSTVNGNLPAELRLQTALGPYDPTSNTSPPDNDLLVVGATDDPAAIEPIAATAIKRGVKIVSFPTPLQHQTAAILVDAVEGAAMLAMHAAGWSRARLGGRAKVLLVLPGASGNPYGAPGATSSEQAFAAALPRYLSTLSVIDTVHASGAYLQVANDPVVKALRAHSDLQMALVWDDYTAVRIASIVQTARKHRLRGLPHELYIGALGAPVPQSRSTLTELEKDDLLRIVIAPRLRDLANAMVDLPRALLFNGPTRSIHLALQTLTPRSAALADYGHDYARTPPVSVDYPFGYLNPPVS